MTPCLTFDAELHQYAYMGRVVPSVTQILKPLTDFDSVPAGVLAAASAFGTAVHKACELWDLGDLDEDSLDPQLAPYLQAWKQFMADHDCAWIHVEQPIVHKQLRYAGTPDRAGLVRGEEAVVDLKSTMALYPSVGPQLAAYDAALQPKTNAQRLKRYGVQLKPDGSYVVKEYKDLTDFAVFASLLTVRNWCAQHEITPKF